jgi:tripartite ATP-independent transporter DctP family solute receptor
MSLAVSRRCIVTGAAGLGLAAIVVRPGRAADYVFRQFHNQSETSSLHRRLTEMWAAVKAETNGRVETTVHAENAGIAGSDPAALKMLVSGELQFFTLMGGILGQVVPAAEVQQVPFAFRSEAEAHAASDGPLGDYIRAEMAAKGIHGFAVQAFDNGMRQISSSKRAIVAAADLEGQRIRLPAGQLFTDTFKALGAEPVTLNVNQIYDGLKSGKADAQENPLAVIELFKLYEVQRYISMTNHMWSGFNLMAHLGTWKALPDGIKEVIERNAAKHVRLQREEQRKLNASLRDTMAARGIAFNDADPASFRARLAPVYAAWKQKLGAKCWSLLEQTSGPLG